MKIRQLITVISAAFISSAALSSACWSVDYPDIAFRCNPSLGGDACPDGYQCCSDDAVAYDLNNNVAVGVVPEYVAPGASRTRVPMFSEVNNVISRTGMCVSESNVIKELASAGQGLLQPPSVGCPTPCNPTWSASQVNEVCKVNGAGQTNLCCQTAELEITDCVYDQNIDCYRPVSGLDLDVAGNGSPSGIFRLDSSGAIIEYPDSGTKTGVRWSAGDHATMQGPNGSACEVFAAGSTNPSAFDECARALSVANQRGYCLTRSDEDGVSVCPLDQPGYVSPCDDLNIKNGKSCS